MLSVFFIPYNPTGLGGALEQYNKHRFDIELEKEGIR